MTEVVVAVFDAASAAEAAVDDLQAARIPSAVVNTYVSDDPEKRISHPGSLDRHAEGSPVVTVSVDAIHTDAVAGILDQHGALAITEKGAGAG